MMSKKLKESISDEILELIRSAEHSRLQKKFNKAADLYLQALSLLSPPINQWEIALTIYLNFGEMLFFQKKYEEAAQYLGEAIKCPHGLGYPWLHLRLGQIRYEQGYFDKAKDELMRAYMGEGESIFESEDPKYFDLIRPLIE
jgi:tetratricopeptide (TPR) repeat protein